MAEALFDDLKLPVGAAEHRNVGEGPQLPLMVQRLGLQHIHAAGDAADLLGDPDALGKVVRRLHQPHGGAAGTVGDQRPGTAGIPFNDRQGGL